MIVGVLHGSRPCWFDPSNVPYPAGNCKAHPWCRTICSINNSTVNLSNKKNLTVPGMSSTCGFALATQPPVPVKQGRPFLHAGTPLTSHMCFWHACQGRARAVCWGSAEPVDFFSPVKKHCCKKQSMAFLLWKRPQSSVGLAPR